MDAVANGAENAEGIPEVAVTTTGAAIGAISASYWLTHELETGYIDKGCS